MERKERDGTDGRKHLFRNKFLLGCTTAVLTLQHYFWTIFNTKPTTSTLTVTLTESLTPALILNTNGDRGFRDGPTPVICWDPVLQHSCTQTTHQQSLRHCNLAEFEQSKWDTAKCRERPNTCVTIIIIMSNRLRNCPISEITTDSITVTHQPTAIYHTSSERQNES